MGKPLGDLLRAHLLSRQTNPKRLAKAAGLNASTVDRWVNGENAKVQRWQDLAQIAHALGLNRAETNALLMAAGQPSLAVLERQGLGEADRLLLAPWPNHLPASVVPVRVSRFVGREQDLADLIAVLKTERMVTLSGEGGSGKTRLALELARIVQPRFDGAYFVDLSAVRDPDRVISAIADTIGFQPPDRTGDRLLPSLAAFLQEYLVLLVLDNFEHVLAAGPRIVALLEAAPGVTALVTSRSFLHVRGEHDYAVDPLPVPAPSAAYKEIAINPAVALFADRARNANRHVHLTAQTAPTIAAICARLGGLPLAIELVAARVRDLSLAQMQDQLTSPLDLAVDGPRDVSRRQSTLRETIAWSTALLDAWGQRWFSLLGVFAGGFTREAMAAVGAAMSPHLAESSRSLVALVAAHLVRKQPEPAGRGGSPRYTMPETIRDYAAETLAGQGQMEDARRAHAHYFQALAERADYSGPDQASWYARIAAERDNIRAALAWCRDCAERETGLRLTLAMLPFWEQRNQAADSLAWMQAFMGEADGIPPTLWARGLLGEGLLLLDDATERDGVLQRFTEALAVFRGVGDAGGESEALRAFGDAHVRWGEWTLARQQYRESLEAARRSGNAQLIALSYMGLAFSAPAFDGLDGAGPYWERTLAWAQRSGHRETIAKASNSLGELARHRGDWDIATSQYEQTLATGEELGSEFLMALASHNLGYAEIGRDDLANAAARFRESLRRYRGLRHRKGMAECLAGLARVAVLEGNDERGARLCGAATSLLAEARTQFDTLDRADYERTLATLRDRLGAELEERLAAGRLMPRDAAVDLALTG